MHIPNGTTAELETEARKDLTDEELLARILDEGHQIGSHPFSNEALTEKTDEEVLAELSACTQALQPLTGQGKGHAGTGAVIAVVGQRHAGIACGAGEGS